MEQTILNSIKELGYPAAIIIALLMANKAGLWGLLADLLRGKINGSTERTVHEKLDFLASNHLHEIKEILEKIDSRLEKMNDNINCVKNGIEILKERTK